MTDDALITWEMLDTTSLTVPTDVNLDEVILEPPVHPVEVGND